MWGTLLPWIPAVLGFAGGVVELVHEGLTGTALAKAAFMLAVGIFTKARGTTGGVVPVTKEAGVRLEATPTELASLPGSVPDAFIPGEKGEPGDRGPKGATGATGDKGAKGATGHK